ncbi:hypothetical protein [Mucisphaera sp.]|uniref:hypothetical protein n=1 Tax=Mucisphaera sp. TaxID=2913024 RepID=UPI003D101573
MHRCFARAVSINLVAISSLQAGITYVDLDPDYSFYSTSSITRSLDLSAITGDPAGINMSYTNQLVLYDFGEGSRRYVNIVDVDFTPIGDNLRFAVSDYTGQFPDYPNVAGIQEGQLPEIYGLDDIPFRPEFPTVLRNHRGVVFGTVFNGENSMNADYLGFTIDPNGPHDEDLSDDLHGWIRIEAALFKDSEEESFYVRIEDYAFETIPGKPLPAGYIPEPTSLLPLALGLSFVKRRTQKH